MCTYNFACTSSSLFIKARGFLMVGLLPADHLCNLILLNSYICYVLIAFLNLSMAGRRKPNSEYLVKTWIHICALPLYSFTILIKSFIYFVSHSKFRVLIGMKIQQGIFISVLPGEMVHQLKCTLL